MNWLREWLVVLCGLALIGWNWWEIRHPDQVRLFIGSQPLGAKRGRLLAIIRFWFWVLLLIAAMLGWLGPWGELRRSR